MPFDNSGADKGSSPHGEERSKACPWMQNQKIGTYTLALRPVTDMDLRSVRAVSVEKIRVCERVKGQFIQKAHGLRGVIAKHEQLMLINA